MGKKKPEKKKKETWVVSWDVLAAGTINRPRELPRGQSLGIESQAVQAKTALTRRAPIQRARVELVSLFGRLPARHSPASTSIVHGAATHQENIGHQRAAPASSSGREGSGPHERRSRTIMPAYWLDWPTDWLTLPHSPANTHKNAKPNPPHEKRTRAKRSLETGAPQNQTTIYAWIT